VDGDCLIYGSVHVKMPRRDVVERVLGIVDYVLLEGLGVRNRRELVRRDWGTMIVVVGLLTYFKILRLLTKAANLYYRSRYGIDFKGDMRYVAELARRVGKRVEIVDEDLLSIYERNREVFRPRLVLVLLVLLLCFVVYGLWATAVGFLTGHYAQATTWLTSLLLTIAVTPILLTAPLINAATTMRDTKLIDRVQELINQGHKVLIVRGERHVEYIVGELRRRGVECEVLS
jgi:Na+/melibiose symporter-like transporter